MARFRLSRKHLKYAGFGFAGAIAALVVWSFIEPSILNVEDEVADVPLLDSSWNNLQIAQISDLQIGMKGGNPQTVTRSVNAIIKRKPVAVLISGDFLYHATPDPVPKIDKVVELLRPLSEANIPVYAVLGNHDYGMSGKSEPPDLELIAQLTTALESIDIIILRNESAEIPHPDGGPPLHLAGIDSKWAGKEDIEKAIDSLPPDSAHVVLMHNPESFEELPENSAAFALAGHTHGGQARVPGFPQWSWLKFVKDDKVYVDGWVKDYGNKGNRLYVNPGIGMSIVPIRLFCPPEVTFFSLQSQSQP
ncbi:MAG: metallophosphoesterase [Limnothrix sp.]